MTELGLCYRSHIHTNYKQPCVFGFLCACLFILSVSLFKSCLPPRINIVPSLTWKTSLLITVWSGFSLIHPPFPYFPFYKRNRARVVLAITYYTYYVLPVRRTGKLYELYSEPLMIHDLPSGSVTVLLSIYEYYKN